MKAILLILMILFITSCNENEELPNNDNLVYKKMDSDTFDTFKNKGPIPSDKFLPNESIWFIDFSHDKEVLKRGTRLDSIEKNPVLLVNLINQQYSGENNPKLEFVDIFKDTVIVEVINERYLTQRMGSAGANAFLAIVIYNMTEIPGINFVKIKFEEGDHAVPGTYSREDFSYLSPK